MIARPVAAALGCRQCQSVIFRAILSRSAGNGIRSLPARQATAQPPILTRRLFSHERIPESPTPKDEPAKPETVAAEETVKNPDAEGEVPWFLEVEPPRHAPSQHAVTLPKIPEDAPEFLEPMLKYIYEDMGLDEISMLDLRELDPPAALGPNLIMLFATARSERHLHVSSGRFVRWLKRSYEIGARADGLIGPGELRTKLRRLRKKAKLLGTNTAIIPGGDNGISTGWVCVNFEYKGHKTGETVSFDESGRFSGFGTPLTGTTIVVQCMTETRRSELDLESLWQGVLKRSLQENKKVRGAKSIDRAELEELLASKVQLPTSTSSLQWQAMKQASQQHRHYSTTARRLSPLAETQVRQHSPMSSDQKAKSGQADDGSDVSALSFDAVEAMISHAQITGRPLSIEALHQLIGAVFRSDGGAAEKRLGLADELLHTADERGMVFWSNELFVTLIESIIYSPAYGPELQRAQRNFEHLMISDGCQPDSQQILRLMRAYASKKDWEKFWDTFRMPPRFKAARDSNHYELAYQAMARTRDQKMCIDALRWVYPEMISQEPPIWPVGQLYTALKACILVADPASENLLQNPPSTEGLRLVQVRRLANREYLKVLQEVEAMRQQVEAHLGRMQVSDATK